MHLTFSCYDTLIDSESGILETLGSLLQSKGVDATDETILAIFAEEEANAETGSFIPYTEVLRQVVRGYAFRYNFSLTHDEADSLATSVGTWRPFPDTVAALERLKRGGHSLTLITNADSKLVAQSAELLGDPFDHVITADDVGAYKPSLTLFRHALQKIGAPKSEIMHVAQSLFHDIVPAGALGLKTAWINRRHGREGWGAIPTPNGRATHEFNDLCSLDAHLS